MILSLPEDQIRVIRTNHIEDTKQAAKIKGTIVIWEGSDQITQGSAKDKPKYLPPAFELSFQLLGLADGQPRIQG